MSSSVWIAFDLNPTTAKRLGSVRKLHLTFMYLGVSEEVFTGALTPDHLTSVVQRFAEQEPCIQVHTHRTEKFGPPGEVLAVLVGSGGVLEKMRDRLAMELETAGFSFSKLYAYRPHVTLGKWREGVDVTPTPFLIDSISVYGGRDVHCFPLQPNPSTG